MGQIIG
jgi:hypothetical protein